MVSSPEIQGHRGHRDGTQRHAASDRTDRVRRAACRRGRRGGSATRRHQRV